MRWPWAAPAPEADPAPEPTSPRILVDGHTRTWWSRGGEPATLVEATGPASRADARRTRPAATEPRPRANPAFAEAVFVELIRAGEFDRAFNLLLPECQESWGNAAAFAAAQRGANALQSVVVKGFHLVQNWTDPRSLKTYAHAAELDAEYTLLGRGQKRVIRRTVHLAGYQGRWRSISYP